MFMRLNYLLTIAVIAVFLFSLWFIPRADIDQAANRALWIS